MDGWYRLNCTRLLDYHSSFTIPNGSDIIFALNPVNPFFLSHLQKSNETNLDGYKQKISLANGVVETYPYDVHGGELYIGIGEPQCPVTVGVPVPTTCQSLATVTVTRIPSGSF
jgi:hypothetical protein